MKAIVKLFNIDVEIDERQEIETLSKAISLASYPKTCTCGNTNISLISQRDGEGNIYINIVCPKCNSQAKLGIYKTGGYFWHPFKNWKSEKGNN